MRAVTFKRCSILYTTFAEKLDHAIRVKILQLAGNFTQLLTDALGFLNSAIPHRFGGWLKICQLLGKIWLVGDGTPRMQ
jgi:hypothetical protein